MASAAQLSPRQRMINLMYLVLTALLALQVSSSIIDKFVFLNSSLEHSLEGAKDASENALAALKKEVAKGGNSAKGQENIKRAEDLKRNTAKLIGIIDNLKKDLINNAGDGEDPKTGSVKNPKEETKVEVFMIGANKDGKAYMLEEELDKYVNYLYKDFADLGFKKPKDMEKEGPFFDLATGNQNNPLYKFDLVQRNKDFALANFGQTPVVAALAVLTQKQNEIIRYEQEVLKELGSGDLTNDIKFNKVFALAAADANTVARGTDYTAQLFLTATSTRTDIKMDVNGSPIKVDEGIGQVKFTATGKGEQEWTGKIAFQFQGKDTSFVVNKKYTVVEPVLLVNSQSKFPLYQNCANPLETAVPALGASYNPTFSVSNGSAIPGAKTGDVTLFPKTLGTLTLSVASGGKPVGSQEFRVRPVPPPDVYLSNRSGSTKIDRSNPIPGNIPGLSIAAEAEETFKTTLPKEAKYRVSQVEVIQFRGGRAIATKPFPGGQINMQQFQTRPGDGFQVKILGVQRVNSRGEILPVKLRENLISFFVR